MKILLLRQYNPFTENGASANRYAGLVNGLLHCGCQVKLVVTGGFCSKEELSCLGKTNQIPGLQIEYSERYMADSLNKRRIHWYLLGWYHKLISRIVLPKYFSEKVDYVWITKDEQITSVFNKCYSKIQGKSLIELNEFNDIYKYHSLNTTQYKKAEKEDKTLQKALSHIDCLAVMTNTLIEHYKQFTKPEAQFIHLPMTVDGSRFYNVDTSNIPYQKPYIAYAGSMSNKKDGVDVLIKAFTKISQKYPDMKLYLAGYYHTDAIEQKAYIAKCGLQDKVLYIGTIQGSDVPTFLCGASVLALPRPDSHQARGGFPTKLGEYLSTGNPVCVTKVGEIPNYLEDNVSAFIAEPGDVDSFVDAMDRALCDNINAKRVGTSGRKLAEVEFNAQVQAKRLADFLEKISK